MKKIFTLLAICMMAITVNAKTITLYEGSFSLNEGISHKFLEASQCDWGTVKETDKLIIYTDAKYAGSITVNNEQISLTKEGTYKKAEIALTTARQYNYTTNGITITNSDDAYEVFNITKIEVDIETTPITINETATSEPSFTAGTRYDPTVNRIFNTDHWNSLCLPFSMTAGEITAAKLGTVMEMTGIENNVVNFETASTITAGNMYIVKPTEEVTSFTVTDKTLSIPEAQKFGTWKVTSPMYQATAPIDSYVLSNDNFYTVDTQDLEIKGFRWYIEETNEGDAEAKHSLGISFNGETTGLTTVDIDAVASTEGKYLENGKLVIVKDGKKFNAGGQRIK